MIEIHPLTGIGEVRLGDDLAGLLAGALERQGLRPAAGDVLVVTQKIVSKAEGRLVKLSSVTPGPEALRLAALTGKDPRLVELVLAESDAVVRAVPNVLITRHRLGLVMANAGIDRSNIGEGGEDRALLLPEDPDASAARLRGALAGLLDSAPAVIVSDSFGRPWRHGVVNVAIGASGVASLVDRRGELDRDGRRLEVTQVALADMIATAAGLATGEGAEGIPAVLVRGLPAPAAPERPAAALARPPEEDLFR
ncbi:MAG TPA: coenzyme F420-0:L-glutamate ligase [Azospirillaceae bacterium]|nr:coenzyme F420-0:L-glutamate ligase [Azospirillaceae bacterium]